MPDVVQKVASNSMSFTADVRPRNKPHSQFKPAPGSQALSSAMTAVPAIGQAGISQSIVRNSREQGPTFSNGATGGEVQYSDLGSSYKSGIASGSHDTSSHLKGGGGSSLSKVGAQPPQQLTHQERMRQFD